MPRNKKKLFERMKDFRRCLFPESVAEDGKHCLNSRLTAAEDRIEWLWSRTAGLLPKSGVERAACLTVTERSLAMMPRDILPAENAGEWFHAAGHIGL